MRRLAVIPALLGLVGPLLAAPPRVTLPAEVAGDVSAFVTLRATTDPPSLGVRYVPLDAGLAVFPAELLADQTTTVVVAAKAGRYRVLAYSGNADGPSAPATTVVVIGSPSPTPPGPNPPVPPGPGPGPTPPTPPTPPVDPLGVYDASRIGALTVEAAARATDAPLLARAARSHAAAVAAGAFADDAAILAGYRAANAGIVDKLRWGSWEAMTSGAVKKAYEAGKIKGNAAWAEVYRLIAQGLEDATRG